MSQIIKADDVKPNFESLKARWGELLKKYQTDEGGLDPRYSVDTPCPHCGSESTKDEFILNCFAHKTCVKCRTVYVSPRLNDASISELYSDEYYSEKYFNSMIPAFEIRKNLIGRKKFLQATSLWGKSGNGFVLDIGAGIGEVTEVFKHNGWNTYATEMNKVAIDWLRQRGHDEVFHGSLEQFNTKKKFDIVMAWGVIEHVINPDLFLSRVNELLLEDGLFASEVPHGESFLVDVSRRSGIDPKRILMGEQHIVLYSTQAYIDLHVRNGFELVHLQTNGLDVSTIFKEANVVVREELLTVMQDSIDSIRYGDLLRGFWRKAKG